MSTSATTESVSVSGTQVVAVPEGATHLTVAANTSAQVTFSIAAPGTVQQIEAAVAKAYAAAQAWLSKNWPAAVLIVLAFAAAKLIK